jgi:hypothetical protein
VLPRCPFPTGGRTVPRKGPWPESQIFPELEGRLAGWLGLPGFGESGKSSRVVLGPASVCEDGEGTRQTGDGLHLPGDAKGCTANGGGAYKLACAVSCGWMIANQPTILVVWCCWLPLLVDG